MIIAQAKEAKAEFEKIIKLIEKSDYLEAGNVLVTFKHSTLEKLEREINRLEKEDKKGVASAVTEKKVKKDSCFDY
jgi:low affinity Fe/Cu permease